MHSILSLSLITPTHQWVLPHLETIILVLVTLTKMFKKHRFDVGEALVGYHFGLPNSKAPPGIDNLFP